MEPSSSRQQTKHATATIITRRKTWKTLKDNIEPVWPPELEVALIEALEKYRPRTTGNTRLLRRFPKRNRWISEYIHRKTGKFRTAKQVGSRLQQLRDTCQEDRIMNLISRREYSPEPESDSCDSTIPPCSSSSSSSLTSSCSSSPTSVSTPLDRESDFVFIPAAPTKPLTPPRKYVSIDLASQPFRCPSSGVAFPNVTFNSSSPISLSNHLSRFHVYHRDVEMHTEDTALSLVYSSPPGTKGKFLYGTSFIPGYWLELSARTDFAQYSVTQDIIRISTTPGAEPSVMLSVVYNFVSSSPLPPPQPLIPPEQAWDVPLLKVEDEPSSWAPFFPPDSSSVSLSSSSQSEPFVECYDPLAQGSQYAPCETTKKDEEYHYYQWLASSPSSSSSELDCVGRPNYDYVASGLSDAYYAQGPRWYGDYPVYCQ